MSKVSLLVCVPFLLALSPQSAAEQEVEPVETDLTEEVEVRFVILDALVLDTRGEVVSDLTAADFELFLDLRPHPVESVDLDCPAGAFADPQPVEHGRIRDAPVAPELPRRVVHVVDYRNLPQTLRVEVLRNLESMVRDYHGPNESLMIVAVTNRLRIEQRFTRDRDELLGTIARMGHDDSLWQERPNPFIHEFDLFDALTALIRQLAGYEGSKALVLFSDLPFEIEDRPFRAFLLATPPAFNYDRKLDELATAATDARVAVYPIRASGLRVESESKRLQRLAIETGGRFTRYTNDLSLPYVRAQRDLACRYAVGFYDNMPAEDRLHRVNIKVRRPGARVIHPVRYRFGSRSEASSSLAQAARSEPAMFTSQSVRGEVFPIRPGADRQWETAVAMRFPVSIPSGDSRTVKFGAKLDDLNRPVVHSLDSSVTVQGHGESGERPFVVIESVDLAPGIYSLSVVVDDPGAAEPRTAVTQVTIPPLPRRGLVVVEPMLIRRAADDVEVQWNGSLSSPDGTIPELEPLLSDALVSGAQLMALTRLCWVRPDKAVRSVRVERTVRGENGEVLFELPPLDVEPASSDGDGCRPVLDELPLDTLEPGSFEIVVSVHVPGDEEPIVRRAPFTLGPLRTEEEAVQPLP